MLCGRGSSHSLCLTAFQEQAVRRWTGSRGDGGAPSCKAQPFSPGTTTGKQAHFHRQRLSLSSAPPHSVHTVTELEGQRFQKDLDGERWEEGLYPVFHLPLSAKWLVSSEHDDARVNYQKHGKMTFIVLSGGILAQYPKWLSRT